MGQKIGVIGAGLIGSAWTIVFARGGFEVLVYDPDRATRSAVTAVVSDRLSDLERFGLVSDPSAIQARVQVVSELDSVLAQCGYIQESIPERVDAKQALYRELGATLPPTVVVGSSSSGIPASAFTQGIPGNERFLIAHPVNPPYLIPVVEIVPAPWTSSQAVDYTATLMEQAGQAPILVNGEVEGFIVNRLQGALLNEAWKLFEEGYASTADIDKAMSKGLGLRWAFMGPFETIDLNAPDGIADYAHRLGPLYHSIACSRVNPAPWSEELVSRVEHDRRQRLAKSELQARQLWRDQRLMALVAHLAGDGASS